MNKFLLLIALSAFLSGCASGVKLDDVPVDERSGTATTPSGAAVAGLDARGLSGVDGGIKAGPAGIDTVVYFDYDSYSVKPEFQTMLDAHARFLRADKNRKAALEGHTDDRGGREYNLALGQKRAEAVRRALSVLGVSDNQIEAVSYGKEKPAASGMDEVSLAKNRRAEISYR
jgi:peptidoglycan-associated lipoprotein